VYPGGGTALGPHPSGPASPSIHAKWKKTRIQASEKQCVLWSFSPLAFLHFQAPLIARAADGEAPEAAADTPPAAEPPAPPAAKGPKTILCSDCDGDGQAATPPSPFATSVAHFRLLLFRGKINGTWLLWTGTTEQAPSLARAHSLPSAFSFLYPPLCLCPPLCLYCLLCLCPPLCPCPFLCPFPPSACALAHTLLLLSCAAALCPCWAGAVTCRQCEGGLNLKDHFEGRFKTGQLCWLCRYCSSTVHFSSVL